MIKGILVGYDRSEQARDALLLGARLATHIDARLIVGMACSDKRLLEIATPLDAALARESDALVADVRAGLPDPAPTQVGSRILVRDSVADGLHDLASYEDIDMVVIGSTHRGPLGRVLPGSLALQLIGRTPCPLMIAPRGFAAGEDPASGPVIVAFDGSELAGRAVAFAARLADQARSRLHVVGVAASAAQVEAVLAGAVAPLGAQLDRGALQRALDEELERLPPDLEAEGTVLEGSAIETLVGLAQGAGGLFVAGSHGRGPLMSLVLGSVSDVIAKRISWPLVLVPPQARVDADLETES